MSPPQTSADHDHDHNSDVFPSLTLDIRKDGNTMTLEEERNYFQQRYMSLRIVLKELQQQLVQYKTRCAGVDTVTLLLKESKHEVVRLNKQCKVLETAVANLQNRLSTNGLSSSIGMEQTEVFVPGASKQTLDNLARENARLRSILKGTEGAAGRKPSDEIQKLKSEVEHLEAENSQLQLQVEEMKASMKEQVMAISLMQEGKKLSEAVVAHKSGVKGVSEVGIVSRGCQTLDVAPSMIEKLKESLKLMTDQCSEFALQLEKAEVVKEEDFDKNIVTGAGTTPAPDVVETKELLEWKKKYEQVVVMNQRWQQHNDGQDRQIHGLLSRIAELEDPETISKLVRDATAASEKDKVAMKMQLDAIGKENNELKRRIDVMSKEMSFQRPQPQVDLSMVEILKQQIQACTEDFNIERRDREQAVHRSEQLQAELTALKGQHDRLKADYANAKQIQVPTFGVESREAHVMRSSTPSTPVSSIRARGPIMSTLSAPSQGIPYHLITQAQNPALGAAWRQQWRRQSHSGDSDYLSGSGSPAASQDLMEPVGGAEFMSLQRYNIESELPDGAQGLGSSKYTNNASMPALSVKRGRKEGGNLSCPKCNREFLENQTNDLLKHMDVCTD